MAERFGTRNPEVINFIYKERDNTGEEKAVNDKGVVIEIEPVDETGLPPQTEYHDTVIKTIVSANQNLIDENNILKIKLRNKEDENQIIREMYHECYTNNKVLVDSLNNIFSIIKKGGSSL